MDERKPSPPPFPAPAPATRPGSFESWKQLIAEGADQPRRRPMVLTVAGALLIVAGAFAAFAGMLIGATGRGATIHGFGGSSTTALIASMALAGLEVATGVFVVRCSPIGRAIGIAVAMLGIVGGLADIGSPSGLMTIAIFGFVLFAIVKNPEAFDPATRR